MSASGGSSSTDAASTAVSTAGRVAELSFFFPAHNEEANLEGLGEEAFTALPA